MTDLSKCFADSTDLVGLVGELVRAHPIYASQGIARTQAILAERLAALGAVVEWQDIDQPALERSPHYVDVAAFGGDFTKYADLKRRNLIAQFDFGGDGPHVVLNGHVDVEFVTAPDSWQAPWLWRSGELRGDRLYGRGASDMLGGVACFVHTLQEIRPLLSGARGRLELQLVVDEEVGGNGTLWALMQGTGRPTFALIAEPTNGLVCSSSRGFYQFRVRSEGTPLHMSFAQQFDNAVQGIAEAALCLEELDDWIRSRVTQRPNQRFVMYGMVSGGTDAAVPAPSAELFVTVATPHDLTIDSITTHLQSLLQHRLKGRTTRIPRIEPYGVNFAGSHLSDTALCERICRHGDTLGIPLAIDSFPSACDARLFEAFGIPSVIFGPGCLSRAHASNEYVTVQELQNYCIVLGATLLDMFVREGTL